MSEARTFDPAGVAFGVLVPVAAAVTVLVTAQAWKSRLPSEIATHFSGGTADGFTATSSASWTFVLVIVLVGGGCSAVAALGQAMLMMRRTMLIVGLAVTGLMLALWLALMSANLDIADPADADLSTTSIAVGILVGGAVGLLGASMLRDHRDRRPATERPDSRLPRGPVDVPIVASVGLGTGTTAVLIGIGALVTVGLCRLAGSWWMLAVFLPVCLLMVGLLRFRVVVDEAGLRVFNMGMCAVGYGVDELEGAKVTEIAPFRDFGGWGLRVKGRGNYGVVTETGPALVFTAANGQRLTVTTDRAEEMAGALNALADRRF
ncbi:DUF1648 domain-containing protein [Rhodococcus sp. Q]|uniref:DUF1648 domain-containing protein n=1 Tax=Rhodococcus sp. Q TaxID=2502252 RepID=UPI0010F9B2C8|nr:DUF1648 domain-containing protein [Rhodococcus sp. Q]